MTWLLNHNSGRSGVVANMKTREFKDAVFYPSTEEDPPRYRAHVTDHNTSGVYCAAVVWIHDNLYHLIDMYLRPVRSQFVTAGCSLEQLFVSSNGRGLTSSQVTTSVRITFEREGVNMKGRI